MKSPLFQFASLLSRREKITIGGLIALMAIGAAFEVVGISAVIPFITMLRDPALIQKQEWLRRAYEFFGSPSHQVFMIGSAAALLFVYTFKNIFLALSYRVQYAAIYQMQVKMSERLFSAYLRHDYVFHLKKNSAELLKNMTHDATSAFHNFLIPSLTLVSECMVVTALFVLLLAADPFTALGAFVTVGGLGFAFFSSIRKKVSKQGEVQQYRYEQIIKSVNQGLGGIKEIKILGREGHFLSAFSENSLVYANTLKYFLLINQLPRLFLETLSVFVLLVIVCITLAQGADLASLTVTLALFAMVSFRLLPSINRIVNMMTTARYFRPSAKAVYENIRSLEEKSAPAVFFSGSPLPFHGTIELKNITFQYAATAEPALKAISLTIKKGSSVAFVGPSGAGKTTLVDVILGLLSPQEGELLIDGQGVQAKISDWQRNIGYIPQSIYLTDDTIRRNIAFGLKDEEINEERVQKAVKAAQLESLVKNLPEGLETTVGERGVRLSGGERQRIGIARAIYNDPEVLVMDEATSSLDTGTEEEIVKAVDTHKGRKTIIVIAHRLTTVRTCDEIYRIEGGALAGKVNYAELLSQNEQILEKPRILHRIS